MRNISFFFIIALVAACSNKPAEIETEIYISAIDTSVDATGKWKLKSGFQSVRFSKDFWNYFLRTHPRTSNLIFIAPLIDSTNDYVSLTDTSYSFYDVSFMSSFWFTKLLADSVGGEEKGNQLGFFVIPEDTTGFKEEEKELGENLKNYTITSTVEKEFNHLKRILIRQDTAEHYIIVFKKKIAQRVFELYK